MKSILLIIKVIGVFDSVDEWYINMTEMCIEYETTIGILELKQPVSLEVM